MQDKDNELDELIFIINNHNTQLNSGLSKFQPDKKTLPPIEQKQKLNTLPTVSIPKFLIFKPWSGVDTGSEHQIGSEAIK